MALSPMMQQYFKVKENYPDTLVFYRLGDFYEMFYEDAVTASRELELTLTGRDCGLEDRAPMCGVPFHAVDTYLARLIDKGFKVAICEQMSNPIVGKIVERSVVRVVTPGTIMDNSMLVEDKNNYLACICLSDNEAGVSWADISTGEINHRYLDGGINIKLNDIMTKIGPREVICNEKMLTESVNLSIVKYKSVCPFSLYNESNFDFQNALKYVEKYIDDESKKNILKHKVCISSAGALLSYIEETQKRTLTHLKKINFDDDCGYMVLDANACRTLELVESNAEGKKRGSLMWILDKTNTGMGARKLRKWIIQPETNLSEINMRLDGVEELIQNPLIAYDISQLLKGIYDLERISGHLSYGNIMPRECVALGESLKRLPDLKAQLKKLKSGIFKNFDENIFELADLCALIQASIEEKPSAFIRDGGIIKDGFDAQLDEYRDIGSNAKKILAKMEADEKEETGIRTLKIGYNKIFGYYIEVPKSQADVVPYRFIRKQTIAGGERYITEELKLLETKILNSQELALKREEVLFTSLLQKFSSYLTQLMSMATVIAYLDCIAAFSAVSGENGYVRPHLNTEGILKITEGRHPVVEKLLQKESYVPNDTYLDQGENKIMLITGPNMAGKSVYMRQTAIIVIMAQIGCFVPCAAAKIPVVDRIFTRVGASDDLSTGRSTFMVEMTEVSYILNHMTDNSLILLDEIGRGTSTYDGLSIAWAIMEYISQRFTAMTLFSTHYHELVDLEGVLSGVKNYKLTVKEYENSIIFLRKLMRGSANKSFGIEVAGLAGLPDGVVSRAKVILAKLEASDIGRQASTGQQISIFSGGRQNEIVSILKDIDIDSISPRQALDILTDLKEKSEL